jgi:hypothetical protein
VPGPLSPKLTLTSNTVSAATLAAQPQRHKAGVTDEPPLQPRAPYVAPVVPASRSTRSTPVTARPPQAQLRLNANARDVRPPERGAVTLAKVESALALMPGNIADRLEGASLRQPEGLFHDVAGFGHSVHHQSDIRFSKGVELTAEGRALLAAYYTRKYQASIAFDGTRRQGLADRVPHIFEHGRGQPGDDVRCAHYFGEREGHGTLLVYIREGGEHGEEALLSFDSTQMEKDIELGESLARGCAPLARPGKKIPVFQHTVGMQRDASSCWIYAMKAATTLTGHRRDANGGHGVFLIPGLIPKLVARATEVPEAPGLFRAQALPDIAKLAQSEGAVLAHAGGELGRPLESASHPATLQGFLEKYTYDLKDNSGKSPPQMLDYMRQKGERLAEIIEIESWSRQIGQALDEAAWGPQQQDLFAREMKKLVRVRPEPLSVDEEITRLQSLWHDPEAFIVQAMKTADQIDAVTTHLSGNARMTALLTQLSTRGLDELEQHLETAERRLSELAGTFEVGMTQLDALYQAHELTIPVRQAFRSIGLPLRLNLDRALKSVEADKLLLATERISRRRALAEQNSFQHRPDKWRVAQAIEAIPNASLPAFHGGAMQVFKEIDETKIHLGAPDVAGPVLQRMTHAELEDFSTDLDLHEALLKRLTEHCNGVLEPLLPDDNADIDGPDSQDEEEDLGVMDPPQAYVCLQSLSLAYEKRMTEVDNERQLLAIEYARRARATPSFQLPEG